jgi:hypothetical protein
LGAAKTPQKTQLIPAMLTIRNTTGTNAQVIANSIREIPARLVPYAASTALTRTAQIAAKTDLPNAMRAVFDNPTPFTLNSLFVKPATKENLSARVMVKDSASRGVVPEKFLFPEVAGGGRNEKGFEKALRYGGWLKGSERAIPADDMPRDAYGNVSGPTIRSILATLEKPRGGASKGRRKGRYGAGIFAGQIGKTRGIWQRDGSGKGRTIKPLFIFTSKQPLYRKRLDFEAVVLQCSNANFKTEFNRAFEEMRAKGKA